MLASNFWIALLALYAGNLFLSGVFPALVRNVCRYSHCAALAYGIRLIAPVLVFVISLTFILSSNDVSQSLMLSPFYTPHSGYLSNSACYLLGKIHKS